MHFIYGKYDMKNSMFFKLWPELALIYASIVWGSTFFIVKGCLTDIHPVTLVAYRFCAAAVILGAILAYFKKPLWKSITQGACLGVLVWISMLTQTLGLQYTSATNSGFITALFVVFVPILNFFLKKTYPSFFQGIAIVLTVFGLWLLTNGIKGFNQGDFLTLLCAWVSAMHILASDKFTKVSDPYTLCFQQFAVIGALSVLTMFIFQLPITFSSTSTGWTLLFLILFPTLITFLIQLLVQTKLEPIRVSVILSLEPLFAALFACWLGGESFSLWKGIGGGLLLTAMCIAELPTSKIRESISEPA